MPRLGWWRSTLATAKGLAQLATDGRPRAALPSGGAAARTYSTVQVPLRVVRTTGRRYGARANDVLLSAFAGGLADVMADAAT